MFNLLFAFITVILLTNAMNAYIQYTAMPDVDTPKCYMMLFKTNQKMSMHKLSQGIHILINEQ